MIDTNTIPDVLHNVCRIHAAGQLLRNLAHGLFLQGVELVVNLVLKVLGLLAEERAEDAPSRGGHPEEDVDEVDPDGDLHEADAGAFVVGAALAVEKDAGKDAKDDEPADGQHGVDDPEAVDGHKGDAVDDGGDGRRARHHGAVHPGRRLQVALLPVLVDAVAVHAYDDEGKDELDAPGDPAGHVLVQADLLGGDALAGSSGNLACCEETHFVCWLMVICLDVCFCVFDVGIIWLVLGGSVCMVCVTCGVVSVRVVLVSRQVNGDGV